MHGRLGPGHVLRKLVHELLLLPRWNNSLYWLWTLHQKLQCTWQHSYRRKHRPMWVRHLCARWISPDDLWRRVPKLYDLGRAATLLPGHDAYAISGCRSESDNFLKIGQPITTVSVNGCTLLGSNPGFFFFGSGNIIINGWQARAGKITAQNASVILNGCSFPADYLKDPVKGSTFNYSDQPNAGYRNHGCAIHHQRV